MGRSWRSAIAILAVAGASLAGCAALRSGDPASSDASVAASPPSALVGTWKGIAWALPGSAYFTSTPVELTIAPDGTFAWRRRGGAAVATGIVRSASPTRVVLQEQKAETAEERIELRRTGDRLWGVATTFIPGSPAAVELDKVNP